MQTDYLRAETALAEAEREAWAAEDGTRSPRLYMPLQETRRQRASSAAKGSSGSICWRQSADQKLDPAEILRQYPHGQLLVAGWGAIEPAILIREQATRVGLYVETSSPRSTRSVPAARKPPARAVVIAPLPDVRMPLRRHSQSTA